MRLGQKTTKILGNHFFHKHPQVLRMRMYSYSPIQSLSEFKDAVLCGLKLGINTTEHDTCSTYKELSTIALYD